MGRKSINTTKSGKYMNPTDQARKEARKRELKKNKKQRLAVRHAVLKAKDAPQLLEEAAMFDKQEYDPNVQASLNERVLQEKRKRLLDTFDRLVLLYRKEDPEYASKLQLARTDYDKRRHEMMLYYEQVKLAERVKASEIPLPDLPPSQRELLASDIPLPIGLPSALTKSILKKGFGLPGPPPGIPPVGRKPPGPPPLPAAELSDSDSEDFTDPMRQKKIRFADSMSMASGGGDASYPSGGDRFSAMQASQIPLPHPPMGLPEFSSMDRPGFTGGLQSRIIMHAPGAVLSAPPTLNPPRAGDSSTGEDNIVSSNFRKTNFSSTPTPGGTTIEAKPRLKNLIGDATRFVPTAVKVKRTVKDAQGRLMFVGGGANSSSSLSSTRQPANFTGTTYDRIAGSSTNTANAAPSKDAAYDEFMREMEGLL